MGECPFNYLKLKTQNLKLTMSLSQQDHEFLHTLTDHFGVTTDTHKIRISVPSGHHVDMQMAGYACAGASARVDARIKTIGMDGLRQTCLLYTSPSPRDRS